MNPRPLRAAADLREAPSDHPEATVRPATAADLEVLGRLGVLLVGIHHDLDGARFVPASRCTAEGYAAWLGERLGEPGAALLVAIRDAQVLGYACGAVEGDDWTALRGPAGVLHDLVVDPAARGQGVGRILLNATLAALASRGAPRAVLMTAAPNAPAQRLAERAGFRRTMIEMTRELGAETR